ncbi:MAG: RNA polymerase sigma factor [Bacteroidaceae bacterium]|nr:RNA polymerase sigma factor [Bacteroidaceae bacterium]
MKHDEAHIIQEILNGKTALYEYFLDRYGQQVFLLVARIVSCQEDAEELTQDIFLKAFRHLHSFKVESSFSTWIYRIAYNTAISANRKRKKQELHWDESLLANLTDEQVDEVLDDESEERLARLNVALEKLDADERAMVTLYYMEDKPISELASIMSITESNAKVRLYRIRKKLYCLMNQGI